MYHFGKKCIRLSQNTTTNGFPEIRWIHLSGSEARIIHRVNLTACKLYLHRHSVLWILLFVQILNNRLMPSCLWQTGCWMDESYNKRSTLWICLPQFDVNVNPTGRNQADLSAAWHSRPTEQYNTINQTSCRISPFNMWERKPKKGWEFCCHNFIFSNEWT